MKGVASPSRRHHQRLHLRARDSHVDIGAPFEERLHHAGLAEAGGDGKGVLHVRELELCPLLLLLADPIHNVGITADRGPDERSRPQSVELHGVLRDQQIAHIWHANNMRETEGDSGRQPSR